MTEERQPTWVWLCPTCGTGDTPVHKNCYGNGLERHEKVAYELVPVVPTDELDKALAALREIRDDVPKRDKATIACLGDAVLIASAALKALDGLREPA